MSESRTFGCDGCGVGSASRNRPKWLTFDAPVFIVIETALGKERVELLGPNGGNDFCCPGCLTTYIRVTLDAWIESAQEEVDSRTEPANDELPF